MRRGWLAGSLVAALGCGSSSEGGAPADGGPDVNGVDVTYFDAGHFGAEAQATDGPLDAPASPVLGAEIDRVGRPGVTLALVAPFASPLAQGKARDAYNADGVPSHWASYAPSLAPALAAFDALDGVCGNAGASLAPVAAGDALWVDTRASACPAPLSIERGVAGACGGWAPGQPGIDVTLGWIAGGAGAIATGVTARAAGDGGFPYLAPP